jgi:hypothetical protein
MAEMAKRRDALLARPDLSRIKFPVMAINDEFDRPLAKIGCGASSTTSPISSCRARVTSRR